MKKWLAVLVAAIMLISGSVVGFSVVSSSITRYTTFYNCISPFDTGNHNFNIPAYNSFVPSSSSDIFIFKFSNSMSFDMYRIERNTIRTQSSSSSGTNCFSSSAYYYLIRFTYDSSLGYFVNSYSNAIRSNIWTYMQASDSEMWYSPNFSLPNSVTAYRKVSDIKSFCLTKYTDYYPPMEYSLTVNYQYSNGILASDSITQTLEPGAEYNIPSPEIEGYIPDIPLVTGTMPEEDLTITVTYTKPFYPLTVKYQYEDGSKAAEDVSFQYPAGFVYDIPSPEIEGYQPDKPVVAGEMPGNALEELVTYSAIPYTLRVQYRFPDGSQAAPDHQEQLTIGSSYSIPSPVVEGYHPNQTAVTGVMPASDVTFTVIYREDSGGSGGPGPSGPGEGGDSGGGGTGDGGGGSGDDPFIPALPPYSGNDPFLIPGLPSYSGYDPFIIQPLPLFSGYDPFAIPGKGGS